MSARASEKRTADFAGMMRRRIDDECFGVRVTDCEISSGGIIS